MNIATRTLRGGIYHSRVVAAVATPTARLTSAIGINKIYNSSTTRRCITGGFFQNNGTIQFPSSRRFFSQERQEQDETQKQQQERTGKILDWLEKEGSMEFSTNSYELERHGRGESFHPTRRPDVIVSPASIDEVVKIVTYCHHHHIPLIPFGVGTSVEGHVCCLEGGISLDMKHFQSIQLPESNDGGEGLPDPIATVGAGVTRMTLNQALRHTGLQFTVDPGADATLGGMMATGASGTTTVRYGTMKDNLMGATCVLPPSSSNGNAQIVKVGSRALKNSAGYDLLSLLCGSEGTLGVICDVTVKLHPIPSHIIAAVCVFDNLHNAAQGVAMLKMCDIPMLRCELLDTPSVAAFNKYNISQGEKTTQQEMVEAPTLFLEFSASSEASLQEQVQMTESILCEEFGGSHFQFTSGEEERKALWSARHSLYYASLGLRQGSNDAILTDACVPLSKFAQIIEATAKDVEELGVVGPCFGHAGDGNFHCILPIVEGDSQEYLDKLHQVNNNLIQRTLQVGGTCTGEHGVGYGKIKYLQQQYGPGAVQMMKAIKQSIDPHNIMNPGKIIDYR